MLIDRPTETIWNHTHSEGVFEGPDGTMSPIAEQLQVMVTTDCYIDHTLVNGKHIFGCYTGGFRT